MFGYLRPSLLPVISAIMTIAAIVSKPSNGSIKGNILVVPYYPPVSVGSTPIITVTISPLTEIILVYLFLILH